MAQPPRRKASVLFDVAGGTAPAGGHTGAAPAESPGPRPPATAAAYLALGLQLGATDALSNRAVDCFETAARLFARDDSLLGGAAAVGAARAVFGMAAAHALRCGDAPRAIELAEAALEQHASAWAHGLLGWCCHAQALRTSDAEMGVRLRDAAADHALAAVGLQAGADAAAEGAPAADTTLLRAAFILADTRRVPTALCVLEQLLRATQLEAPAFVLLAAVHTSAGELDRAAAVLAAMREVHPRSVVGAVMNAAVGLAAAEAAEGEQAAEDEGAGEANPAGASGGGVQHGEFRRRAAALASLATAVSHSRLVLRYCAGSHEAADLAAGHEETAWDDPAALALHALHYLLLVALVATPHDAELAAAALSAAFEAVEVDAWPAPPELLAALFAARATLHRRRCSPALAQKAGEAALAADINCVDAHCVLGQLTLDACRDAAAVGGGGDEAPARHRLHQRQREQQRQTQRDAAVVALSHFESAIRVDPTSAAAHRGAAECHDILGASEAMTAVLLHAAACEMTETVLPLRHFRFMLE